MFVFLKTHLIREAFGTHVAGEVGVLCLVKRARVLRAEMALADAALEVGRYVLVHVTLV